MARESRTDIQKTEKAGMAPRPEQTRPGPVYSPLPLNWSSSSAKSTLKLVSDP